MVGNLLSNAIKFTPEQGKIEVLLERVNSQVEITVSDNGKGISPQFLPHMFERFRQADSSTSRQHGGLGIGLSIARELVELHGGQISAKSAGEGRGSTFIIALPLVAARHTRAIERPCCPDFAIDPSATDLSGIKVLVVDDEPDARQLVTRLLNECDAEVFVAASAQEALQLLERVCPHVLVSDIGMPGTDGYQLIRQIRSRHTPQKLPALALTAFARSEDRRRAMLAGYQMHLAKPLEPRELVVTVSSLAQRANN